MATYTINDFTEATVPVATDYLLMWVSSAGTHRKLAIENLFNNQTDIGIGTDTPTYSLHLKRTASDASAMVESDLGNAGLLLDSAATTDPYVKFMEAGVGKAVMGVDGSDSDKFKLGVGSAATPSNLATVAMAIDTSSNVTLGAALTVAGNTTLSGALTVTGATTLNGNVSLGAGDTLTVGTGATSLGGTLAVTGAATLSSTLAVTGATTLGGALTVTGAATFNGSFGSWTTLTPNTAMNWAQVGGTSPNAGHRKIGDIVFLRGGIKRTSGTSLLLATLPVGRRPAYSHSFNCTISENGSSISLAYITIASDGTITLQDYAGGAVVYVMLDGVFFATA